jgi:Carbohydrate-selective porin, OprB family/S-layer homology domain
VSPCLLQQYFLPTKTLNRVTSVSQLSDVHPTDWAYQALNSLIERYNCLLGYPDGTYQGDRPQTRFEFAAGLAACLDGIKELIAASTAEIVKSEDLATLERLQSEFAAELSTLRGRIDNLEARTSRVEAQQFSPITKLRVEAIFGLIAASGGDKADGSDNPVETNLIFGDRVRVGFNTSFTGEDSLFLRLQARNFPNFQDVTGTPMARLSFDGSNENQLEIDTLKYTFPIGEQVIVHINAQADAEDFVDTLNPLLDSGGRGSISRFGRRNPIYRQIGSTGVGIDYAFNKSISLGLGYLADNANAPASGLFNGLYGAIAQLILRPSAALNLGLTYIHSYNTLETDTGSQLANDPFDGDADAVRANSFGFEVNFRISSALSLGGWVGYTKAFAEDLPNQPEAEIFNYAITLAFPDLGGKGNLAGLVVGQPPKVTRNDLGNNFTDADTSLHLEVFYRFQANENIFITPGLFIITNPDHDESNDTLYLAVLRTTFRF